MEIINFRSVERSTQDVPVTINGGSSERWNVQSQKTKYVNGKPSGIIEVGYTASLDNSNFLLKEDKSNNWIQIKALGDNDTSGLCVLTQNESGNKINLHLTTPTSKREDWEIHFNPVREDTSAFFDVTTNIYWESGSMNQGTLYRYLIVNQDRHTINIHISTMFPGNVVEMLSWSCLDKNGNAFSPNYIIPDNQYFTIKATGLGSYTLKRDSTPPLLAVVILYSPVGLTPLTNIH